jgi:hypothetical protein
MNEYEYTIIDNNESTYIKCIKLLCIYSVSKSEDSNKNVCTHL